jgi:short-subunit dehydrogenase
VQRWGWLLPDDPAVLRSQELGEPQAPWSPAALDQAVAVNLQSFLRLAVLAMPALVRGADARKETAAAAAAKEEEESGGEGSRAVALPSRVVVVSSGAGKMPCPKQSVYAAAKHGLHGFFDSLRLEAEHKALPVAFTVCVLGLVETATAVALTKGDVALPMGQPEAAAAAIVAAAHWGQEELYWPPAQGLHLVAALRPLPGLRWALDRLTLAMSGGNFSALLGASHGPAHGAP